jgi:hypothetical protein
MLIAVVLFTTNCKSSKKAPKAAYEDEQEIVVRCSGPDYQSTEGFIRANSMGESNDMVLSKKIAKSNTLDELSSKIEVTVKTVIDNYNSRRQKNMEENVEKRYEELIRTVVSQKINGYKNICEKVTKTADNKYRTYLAFELPIDNVLNPIYDKISKDNELKIDYDYQKFKNTFNEEMQNAENK